MQKIYDILDLLKRYYKYVFIIILVIVLSTITYINGKGGEVLEEEKLNINIPEVEKKEQIVDDLVIIDIKGAVINPGAYKLKSDKRIYDAIRVSGGLSKDADTTLVNLSKKLKDEMVIIIHTKEQVDEYTNKEPTIIYKEVECVCPELKNDGCVIEETPSDEIKISLNNASMEELMELPGIGESKANSIIEYRKQVGGFSTIEELLEVKGIGESVFDKLKDLITI